MRPVEFTSEKIIEAGLALQGANRIVTGFAIRERIGGGNVKRLKQVWDEHLVGRSVVEAEPVAELPVEVAEEVDRVIEALCTSLKNFAVNLNDKTVKASERRVHEAIRTAGIQRQQADQELADASTTVEDLEQQLDVANKSVADLQLQLSHILAEKQTQAVELAQRQARVEAVETTVNEVSAELLKMQKQLEQARKAELEARERAAKLEGQHEAINAQNIALLERLPGL